MVHNEENQERATASFFSCGNNSNGIAAICPDWCYYWIENSIFALANSCCAAATRAAEQNEIPLLYQISLLCEERSDASASASRA